MASDRTIFRNVRVFDGRSPTLTGPRDVIVRGRFIESVQMSSGAPYDANDVIIEAGGRVLMPGLIDAHWHAIFAAVSMTTALTADAGYLHLTAGVQAERTLLRGFTTVRDAGGPVFALKRAIDEGVIPGPRIFPPARSSLRHPDTETSGRGTNYRDIRAGRSVTSRPPAHPRLPMALTRCCARFVSS